MQRIAAVDKCHARRYNNYGKIFYAPYNLQLSAEHACKHCLEESSTSSSKNLRIKIRNTMCYKHRKLEKRHFLLASNCICSHTVNTAALP